MPSGAMRISNSSSLDGSTFGRCNADYTGHSKKDAHSRLLRQAHGMVPKRTLAPLRLRDEEECTEIDMQLGGTTTVFNVLEAEKRLQGGGHLLSIMDLIKYGKLPEGRHHPGSSCRNS